MGRKRGVQYQPGDFWRIDDRSGFAVRAQNTAKEWTGLWVDQKLWEIRQPQDFVTGVKDDQSVPEARPQPPAIFGGPIYLQLSQSIGPAFSAQLYLVTEDGINLTTEDGTPIVTEGGQPPVPYSPYILYVESVVGVSANQNAAIFLNTGELFYFVIRAVLSGNRLFISAPIPYPASVGNEIIDFRTPYAGVPFPEYLVTESGEILMTEDGVPISV